MADKQQETAQAEVFDSTALKALPEKLRGLVKKLISLGQDSLDRERLIKDFARENNASLDKFGELFYQGYSLNLGLRDENDLEAEGYRLLAAKKLKLESFASPIAHFIFPNWDKSFFLKKYTGINSNQKPDNLDAAEYDATAVDRLYGDLENLSRNSLSHPVLEERPQDYLSYANTRFFISNPEALAQSNKAIELESKDTLRDLIAA